MPASHETLREIVSEGMSGEIPVGTLRDLEIPHVDGRASVIIGPRRSGKTFRMYQHARELIEQGALREQILFVDFEDDRLAPCDSQTISRVVSEYEVALSLRGVDPGKTRYLFLDEPQAVPDWGRQVRRLLASRRYEVLVTGSSAKMLSTEIATEFRGRSISCEMFPYSFREYLRNRNLEGLVENLTSANVSQLSAAFEMYLAVGGFPEAQQVDIRTRVKLQQELVDVVIARDICARHDLAFTGVEAFVKQALRTSGREFSVSKIYGTLKSMQVPLSRDTAYALPGYCEDAYLFFVVPQYTRSYRTAKQGSRKLYSVDPGLQYAVGPSSSNDTGIRLEDAVFVQLRRKAWGTRLGGIATYRTSRDREVDFAVGDAAEGSPLRLIQVSAFIDNEQTARREYGDLAQALDETGVQEGEVVVLDAQHCVQPQDGRIKVVSAWEWFLA